MLNHLIIPVARPVLGRKDQYARRVPYVLERLVECFKIANAPALHTQVFTCMRLLLARVSSEHLNALWPFVLMELIRVLQSASDRNSSAGAGSAAGVDTAELQLVLAACKFIDTALVLLPSHFHLYRWMFVLDAFSQSLSSGASNSSPVTIQLGAVPQSSPRADGRAGSPSLTSSVSFEPYLERLARGKASSVNRDSNGLVIAQPSSSIPASASPVPAVADDLFASLAPSSNVSQD